MGLLGVRCGEAGEFWEDADEPPPEASGEKLPPLSIAMMDSGREEAVKDATSDDVCAKDCETIRVKSRRIKRQRHDIL